MEVLKNNRGEWCVAIPVERQSFGTVHSTRSLHRLRVPHDADISQAVRAAQEYLEGRKNENDIRAHQQAR